MVARELSGVWDILDEVIREHPVMLTGRQPCIRSAFSFRADADRRQSDPPASSARVRGRTTRFDRGDHMAVHVPLSVEAQVEARHDECREYFYRRQRQPIIGPTRYRRDFITMTRDDCVPKSVAGSSAPDEGAHGL